MVDRFPSDGAAPDHGMQLRIDEDLRNAQQLNADFEREFPETPGADRRQSMERFLRRPNSKLLYPALAATGEHGAWLMPLVRRFAWNQGRGEAGSGWTGMLAEMVRLTLCKVRRVSEDEFVALAEAGEALLSRNVYGYLEFMAALACGLEKTGPLHAASVDALGQLLQLCDARSVDPDKRERLWWPLFRSGAVSDDGGTGWSARLRGDIAAMASKSRTDWLAAFTPEVRTCKAAVKRLGGAEVESGLRRWIRILREVPEPLSLADTCLLRHILTLCELLDGAACDQVLYEIACVPWTQKPEHRWMYHYLALLRARPQNRAFACLEALMMNSATASESVRAQYDALLAVFSAEGTTESPVGVDGFPLDAEPALSAEHRRIDQLLRMAASAAAAGRYVDPGVSAHVAAIRSMSEESVPPAQWAALKAWEAQMTRPLPWFPVSPDVTQARKAMEAAIIEEFSSTPASLNRAMTARAEWIRAHQNEYSKDQLQLWNEWLHGLGCGDGLVGRSLAKVDELTLESLISSIKAGGASSKVFELCRRYVATHGWHIDLVEPFRKFIPRLGVPCNQTECAQAEWFLWFEDVAPIALEECWSSRVKSDLRKIPAEEAAAWRALLDNTTFAITGTPPGKWRKAAERLFPEVGAASFRRHFVRWFQPFADGDPQRITITGRNILRVLIWYALLAKDVAVDQALVGFANARWKNKQYAKRVAQAEMAFSYVLGEREPTAALPILEALVASGHAFEGSTTHRVYQELCARQGRKPVKATPQETKLSKEPDRNASPVQLGRVRS